MPVNTWVGDQASLTVVKFKIVCGFLFYWIILVSTFSTTPAKPHIRTVHIQSLGVFNPAHEEFHSFPFPTLNHLHWRTQDSFIRKELLFHEGDPFDAALMKESERNLRRYPFLTDVSITTAKTDDGQVDVSVKTEDQWTTRLIFSAGKSRGYRNLDFGLEEDNFLGLGKQVGFRYSEDVERKGITGTYLDPRFLNTRLRFQTRLSKNSDGYEAVANINHPFYSQEADWAYGFHFGDLHRTDHIYYDGKDAVRLDRQNSQGELFFTRSWGNRYHHVRIGPVLSYEELLYPGAPHILDDAYRQQVEDNLHPVERRVASLGITLQSDRQDYVKFTYLDNWGRNEDLPIGFLASTTLLQSRNDLGPDYSTGAILGRYSFQPGESQFAVGEASFSVRRESGEWTNMIADLSARYYRQIPSLRLGFLHAKQQTIAAQIAAILTSRMDSPFQLTLGSEEGLRGYGYRQFAGANRVTFNLEDRIFTSRENRLLGWGVAPFVDTGYIWSDAQAHWGADAGIGLRIGFKKYGRTKILRIDFAVPLTAARSHGVSISITSGQIFNAL